MPHYFHWPLPLAAIRFLPRHWYLLLATYYAPAIFTLRHYWYWYCCCHFLRWLADTPAPFRFCLHIIADIAITLLLITIIWPHDISLHIELWWVATLLYSHYFHTLIFLHYATFMLIHIAPLIIILPLITPLIRLHYYSCYHYYVSPPYRLPAAFFAFAIRLSLVILATIFAIASYAIDIGHIGLADAMPATYYAIDATGYWYGWLPLIFSPILLPLMPPLMPFSLAVELPLIFISHYFIADNIIFSLRHYAMSLLLSLIIGHAFFTYYAIHIIAYFHYYYYFITIVIDSHYYHHYIIDSHTLPPDDWFSRWPHIAIAAFRHYWLPFADIDSFFFWCPRHRHHYYYDIIINIIDITLIITPLIFSMLLLAIAFHYAWYHTLRHYHRLVSLSLISDYAYSSIYCWLSSIHYHYAIGCWCFR